jgi:hypothetical protein
MRRISSAWTSTRAFFRRHPWLVLVIGVVLGAGIGAGAADDRTDEANAANARADRFRGLYHEEQRATDEMAAKISRQSKRLDQIDQAKARLAAREADLDDRSDRLDARSSELDQRARDVAAKERRVDDAQQTLRSSTIPDGIWQLGRDYEAGTYRAPGGGGCYWALLGSADTEDIVNNGGFSKNQTIAIDSPFFETEDCGDWVKIG